MGLPDRKWGNSYRYGFNGKEDDNEIKGGGNQQDYGMRIYDPWLGKFLSVDPLTKGYPMLTPYQFASNSPIAGIDLDGGEFKYYTLKWQPQADGESHLRVDKQVNQVNRSFTTAIVTSGMGHPTVIAAGTKFTPPILTFSNRTEIKFSMEDLGMDPIVVSPDGKTWRVVPAYMDLYDLPALNNPVWNTFETPDQYIERFVDGANKVIEGARTGAQVIGMLHGAIKNGKLGSDKNIETNDIGAPEGWIVKPSKKGGGTRYIDPNNSRNVIREMPGDHSSPFPSQQVPYVKYQKNGRFFDKDGNPLSGGDLGI